MPNLNQLIEINKKYNKIYKINHRNKIIENLQSKKKLLKAAAFDIDSIVEHFDLSKYNSKADFKSELINFFESNSKSEVVFLFIDICSFSEKILRWNNDKINKFLNSYYQKAFYIITDNYGQIEKLMGDGIVCVFGKPFISTSKRAEFFFAENCAKELIEAFSGTKFEIKVALHSGSVKYYKTPVGYAEYTMIGRPITELYRLESISENNSVNFYTGSIYDQKIYNANLSSLNDYCVEGQKNVRLQGVMYKQIKYLTLW